MVREDTLLRTSQSGVEASLDDRITQVIYLLNASPKMNTLLQGTEFQKDPKGVLKAIFTGEWNVPGWLSAGTAALKACITKFLHAHESTNDSSHLVAATSRLIALLAYVYGPDAYLSWQMQWQYQLPMLVSLPHIHPVSMQQFANGHIAEWMSPTTTNNLKSWLERKGTLKAYIQKNMVITAAMMSGLQEASALRVQGEHLARFTVVGTGVADSMPKSASGGTAQGGQTNSKGANKANKKQGKKSPMSGLRGYCMSWLQTNKMPCANPVCLANATKPRFKHRTEFDAEAHQVRVEIIKEAKVLSPANKPIQVHA